MTQDSQTPTVTAAELRLTNEVLESFLVLWLKSKTRIDQDREVWVWSLNDYIKTRKPGQVWLVYGQGNLYQLRSFQHLEPLLAKFGVSVDLAMLSEADFKRLYEDPNRLMLIGAQREQELQREAEQARLVEIRAAMPPRPADVPYSNTGLGNVIRIYRSHPDLTIYDLLRKNEDQIISMGFTRKALLELVRYVKYHGFMVSGDPNWPQEAISEERLFAPTPEQYVPTTPLGVATDVMLSHLGPSDSSDELSESALGKALKEALKEISKSGTLDGDDVDDELTGFSDDPNDINR